MKNAKVRLGGKRDRTGRRGRAGISRRFVRTGRKTARITKTGFRGDRVHIRIVR